jgi:hypothetical protein
MNFFLERETGIEPATNSLEGCDSTTELLPHHFQIETNGGERRIRTSVGRSRQIYSLLRLTTPPSLHETALAQRRRPDQHSGQPAGAGDGTRTRDLLITNQLLYQLSYASSRLRFQ